MILSIYLATIALYLGTSAAVVISSVVKAKREGLKLNQDIKIPVIIISIFALIVLLIGSLIPVLNVISSIKSLRNFNDQTDKILDKLEEGNVIENEEVQNKKNTIADKILKKNKNDELCSIVESMIIEGATEEEISDHIEKAKEYINPNVEKERKAKEEANNFVSYVLTNTKLTSKQIKKLLLEYKKGFLLKSQYLYPVDKTLKMAYKKQNNDSINDLINK